MKLINKIKKLSRPVLVTIISAIAVPVIVLAANLSNLNGLTTATQTFTNDTNVQISSSGSVHTIVWNGHLPVSRGGTGTGSFTTGSVLFASSASVSQDNSNFFWDNTNKRLGIGTKTPLTSIDTKGTLTAQQVTTNSIVASGSNQSLSLSPTGTGKVLIGGESLVVARLTSEPASASTGQIYFDRTLGKFRGFNGIHWISLNPGTASVSALIIAGGGGGGTNAGGGGGAGGYQEIASIPVGVQSYIITIGNGGAADTDGGNSSAFGYTSAGGGAGAEFSTNGNNGGSGGGASGGFTGGVGSQGNNGGGNGSLSGGTGGSSIGGAGGNGPGPNNGGAGTTNTGSGGGGGSGNNGNGGAGSSGVVIIRYLDSVIDATGGVETTDGAYRIHTFNSSGTFTVMSIN